MRYVFHSFDYQQDNWRVNQVRHIGTVEGDRKLLPNEWQTLKSQGDAAVKRWIDNQLYGKSCTIVMIGPRTATRPWVIYEIQRSWALRKGVMGIYIHNLKDSSGYQSPMGFNPFDHVGLTSVAPAYNPPALDSTMVHAYIAQNIEAWVDDAIARRQRLP